MINNRPENRVYRYNFFFDNCATRPAAIIEKLAGGKIDYNVPFKQQTFRDLINYCTRNKPGLRSDVTWHLAVRPTGSRLPMK